MRGVCLAAGADSARSLPASPERGVSRTALPPAAAVYDKALALYLQGEFTEALAACDETLRLKTRHLAALGLRARLWHVLGNWDSMTADAKLVLEEFKSSAKGMQDYLAAGSAAVLLGDADAAFRSFDAARRWEGAAQEALAGRARAWRLKGDPGKALAEFEDVFKYTAQPPPLYRYNRAQAFHELGRHDEAVAELTAALKANRRLAIAYALLGATLAKKGDLQRAEQAYTRALGINREHVFAYLGRAAARLARGAEAEAFQDYAEAAAVRPYDYSIFLNRAEAHFRRGGREEAVADYRKVLDLEIRDWESASLAAERLAYYQLWPEALAALTKALALKPSAALLVRRAQAHEALKKRGAALEDLSEAVDLEPGSAAAWIARGQLHLRLDKDAHALADFNAAIKAQPRSPEPYLARGSYLARAGKPNAALDDFNAAVALAPAGSAEALNNRGALYANAFFDLDKALRDIEEAVRLGPKDPSFRFNLGVVELKRRNYQKALEAFNEALRLRGPAARIQQYRAEAHSLLGNQTRALQDIQAALEKDPENPALYDALGMIRFRGRDFEVALQDFEQALKLNGRHGPARIHKAAVLAHLGRLKKSRKELEEALEDDKTSKEAFTELCHVRRFLKEQGDAVKDCSRAIELDPLYGPAYLHRGLAFAQQGLAFKAVDDLDRAARLGVKRPEGLLALALAHASAGQLKQAHRAYLEAQRLDPAARTPEILFGLARGDREDFANALSEVPTLASHDTADPYLYLIRGDAHHSADRFDRAIQEYTRAMEVDGTLAEAYVARGIALIAQDALEAAQQDFLRAAELDAKDSQPHIRLATLYGLQGRFKDALKHSAKAIALDPQNPEAHLRSGNLYYFMKDYAKALERYRKAVELDPASPAAQNGCGMGHFALREHDQAISRFSAAIALYPRSDRYYKNRGSAYTNKGEFSNAAADFKSASLVNSDPALNDEYALLIREAQTQAAAADSAAAP